MKKLFKFQSIYVIAFLYLCLAVSGCSKDSGYESPLIGVSISDVQVDAAGGLKEIKIGKAADLSALEVYSNESWCWGWIDVASSTIQIYTSANNAYDDRKAVITIKDLKDNSSSLKFNVVQEKVIVIEVDKNKFSVRESGGTVSVNVKSDIDYKVHIPESCDWVKLTSAGTRGMTESKIEFTVSKFDSGDSREVTITISDDKNTVSQKIEITQTFKPQIVVDESEYTVTNEGGILEVPISTNSKITVDIQDSWVTNEGYSNVSGSNYILKLNVKPNLSNSSRQTTITLTTVSNSSKNKSKTITIYQKAALSIAPTEIELMEGDTYSLQLTNNTNQSVTWSSSNTSVATVNNSGVVTGVSKGNATITVKTADGKYFAKATVAVGDITNFITARSGASSIVMVNNLIQYGSSLGWIFTNNSTKTVKLKSLQLVDGATGSEGNIMDVNAEVPGGSSVSNSTTIGLLGIHTPVTCRFRYEYKGKEYMTTAVFNSLW